MWGAGLISRAQIEDINARADCVALATGFGAVLRRSGRNMIGSCPMCSAKNPKAATRFEVTRDKWVCAVCPDGGDAIALVQKATGRDFAGACEFLGGAQTLSPAEQSRLDALAAARAAKAQAESDAYRARELETVRTIWRVARAGDTGLVRAYLEGRALDVPDPLFARCAAQMPFWHGKTVDEFGREHARCIHRGPAMLAAMAGPDGAFCALHITWIDPDQPGQKARIIDPDTGEILNSKKMRGSTGCASINLTACPSPRRLYLAEGLETALSARTMLRSAGLLRPDDGFRAAGSLGTMGGPSADKIFHPERQTCQWPPRQTVGPRA